MENLPELKTHRLLLNKPTESDLEDITAQINATKDIARNIFNIPTPYTVTDAQNWLMVCTEGWKSGTAYRFAIREKEAGKLIGMIGLHPVTDHNKAEVGYWLGRDYWAKGYATETLTRLLKFGFDDLKLNKIYATHFVHNPASGKVMLKAGMKHEGLLRQEYRHQDEFHDVHRYAILNSEWVS